MHLGFHIYDVGFQSPNVEAARPLVYATALLLVLVIVVLNLTAISLRNHFREHYRTGTVMSMEMKNAQNIDRGVISSVLGSNDLSAEDHCIKVRDLNLYYADKQALNGSIWI